MRPKFAAAGSTSTYRLHSPRNFKRMLELTGSFDVIVMDFSYLPRSFLLLTENGKSPVAPGANSFGYAPATVQPQLGRTLVILSVSDPLLVILKKDPSVEVRVTKAKLVGNYAIQFTWSDGHDTGIFDFRLLRSLEGSGA